MMKQNFLVLILLLSGLTLWAQTPGQIYVKKELTNIFNLSVRSREAVKEACRMEEGLVGLEANSELITAKFRSPDAQYQIQALFYFDVSECTMVKIEITAADTPDVALRPLVEGIIKKKFKIKKHTANDAHLYAEKYFISNDRFSGIMQFGSNQSKVSLTLSLKKD